MMKNQNTFITKIIGPFKRLSLKKILYAALCVILAMCLVFASFLLVFRVTFLKKAFIPDVLNSSDYFTDLKNEITSDLADLGDASGLDRSFFDDELVDDVIIRKDVRAYLDSFYEGKAMRVNTSNFEESFRDSIKSYIQKKGIKKVDDEKIDYLVAKACEVYSNDIKIPYLSGLQKTVADLSKKVTIIFFVLMLVSAGIICVLIFTNEWKHKSLRYIYVSTCSSGLFLLITALTVTASGVKNKIAIMSRSLSDLYLAAIDSFVWDLIVVAIVLFVASAALWTVHGRLRRKNAL